MDEKVYSKVIDASQELARQLLSHTDEPDDKAVMQALAKGSEEAMALLYQRYNILLYSLALRMTSNQTIAEDMVQEAFLAAWRHAASYKPETASVRAWLLSITHYRVIDNHRRQQRRVTNVPLEEADQNEDTAVPDVWEDAWQVIERSLVRESLDVLPRDQRAIIDLIYFHNWTHVKIAERLNIPLGTVKSRLRLALLRLKREFERRGLA